MQHVVDEDRLRRGESRSRRGVGARELPSRAHHEQHIQTPRREPERRQQHPGANRHFARRRDVTQCEPDQPREHQRQAEQQRPVDRAPRRRPGDDGELRRAVADEQRMRQPGAPEQQRAAEEAQRVEGRAAPDGHRSCSERWALI